ncbi:MAG TPA: hypothetical protein P5069_03505, partial [Candidatus Hydrogenedentes bacterium]|nr:hypothetical protein [Candidatus Hydrogenedentota bacterium]
MNLLVCPLLCLTAALSTVPEPEHWAQRLSHNDPNLVVDLGVGLWALPLPMDYDGDGDMDLMVSCADVPARGLHYFENEGNGVFAPGVLLDTEKRPNVTVSYVDGVPRVCEPGKWYADFPKNGYAAPVDVSFKPDFHIGRANQWRFADYDGDGAVDLIL